MLFRYIERNTKNYAHLRTIIGDQQNAAEADSNLNKEFIEK